MVCFSERATAKLKLMEEKQQLLDEKNRRASEALARKAAGEFSADLLIFIFIAPWDVVHVQQPF